MSEFKGTAEYYGKFRPGIPADVANRIIHEANRYVKATSLLDVGTGTGQVVEALHPAFTEIVAIDPDPQMLAVAEERLRTLRKDGKFKLTLWHGRAEDFSPPAGWSASVVTFCRAFHWVDQPRVLRQLSTFVPSSGLVAIFGDRSFWDANSDWKRAVRDVIRQFLGEERRAGEGVFTHHNRPYSDILRESPFSNVEEVTMPIHRTWTADSILGYLYSTSFAAPPLFGARLAEFDHVVRGVLAEFSSTDAFHEENEFLVRFGRKQT